VRRSDRSGAVVRLSAADPLNLAGIIVPGARIAAIRANTVEFRDGLPVLSEQESQPVTEVGSEVLA
jgi:ATP-dependent Lhr-like helicase